MEASSATAKRADSSSLAAASPDLKEFRGLTFQEKWAVVGAPKNETKNIQETTQWSNPAPKFSRMAISFRLRNTDSVFSELVGNSGASASKPCSPASSVENGLPRPTSFVKIEAGSPLRFMKASSTGNLPTTVGRAVPGVDRPDYLAHVSHGLNALKDPSKKTAPIRAEDVWAKLQGPLGGMDHNKEMLQYYSMDSMASETASTRTPGSPPSSHSSRLFAARGRAVTLAEFSRWCHDKFGSPGEAWQAIAGKSATVSRDQLVSQLKTFQYDGGEIGAKALLFFLDRDRSGMLHSKDVLSQLDEVAVGRTEGQMTRPQAAVPKSEAFEVMGNKAQWSLNDQRTKLLETLWKQDAPVAQLLEYLFITFTTLSMAFKQFDLNGNGLLSKSEFTDGLKAMRSRDNTRPIQTHMIDLFNRIDKNRQGAVTFDEVIDALDGGTDDQLVRRLCKFIIEQDNKSKSGEVLVREKIQMVFPQWQISQTRGSLVEKATSIQCRDFVSELLRLKYHEWHARELFGRLDEDNSGQLSIEEFTSFLEKAPSPKRDIPLNLVPLGNEERRKELEGAHVTSHGSPKLARMGARAATAKADQLIDPNQKWQGPNGKFLQTNWRTEAGATSLVLKRPVDHLEKVRKGLQKTKASFRTDTQGHSQLTAFGAHRFVGNPEPAVDMTEICNGLRLFSTTEARTRIDAI